MPFTCLFALQPDLHLSLLDSLSSSLSSSSVLSIKTKTIKRGETVRSFARPQPKPTCSFLHTLSCSLLFSSPFHSSAPLYIMYISIYISMIKAPSLSSLPVSLPRLQWRLNPIVPVLNIIPRPSHSSSPLQLLFFHRYRHLHRLLCRQPDVSRNRSSRAFTVIHTLITVNHINRNLPFC
jgi:hypothetical protein